MKCPGCNTDLPTAPPDAPVGCLNRGRLLKPAQLGEQAPAPAILRHSYTTPCAKLLAQVQKSGSWVAVSRVAVPEARKAQRHL